MVMLDLFAQKVPRFELMIAHFDHGVRKNSKEDADFVRRRAEEYGIGIVVGRGELGENASEEKARTARYNFLKRVAAEKDGEIYTAHHLDDLVGSVAINLIRGTGWRGLAAMNAAGIRRPLLNNYLGLGFKKPPTKKDLLRYAGEHNLRFREDQSNSSDEYLRNRLYHQVNNFDEKMEVFELWLKQIKLRNEIETLIAEILPREEWQRDWFKEMPGEVALEMLRAGLLKKGIKATRPQLRDFLKAIREYTSGKYFNLPNDKLVRINRDGFSI